MRRSLSSIVLLLLMPLSGPAALADEAAAALESLYGDEIKRVRLTPDGKDDVQLAEKLIGDAQTTDSPALAAVMCNTAYDLADKRNAPAVAAQAMRILIDKAPDKAADARPRLVLALRKIYAIARGEAKSEAGMQLVAALVEDAGTLAAREQYPEAMTILRSALPVATAIKSPSLEGIKGMMEHLTARQQAAAQVARLRERLLETPDDAAMNRDLARLLLIELDQPHRARPHALKGDHEPLKKFTPLAASPVSELTTAQCIELADWYRGLFGEAGLTIVGKRHVLLRAQLYYERVIEAGDATRLNAETAKLALGTVNENLAKFAPPAFDDANAPAPVATGATGQPRPTPRGKAEVLEKGRDLTPADGAVDLIKLIRVNDDANTGRWVRQNERVIGFNNTLRSTAHVIIPVTPASDDYEIELKFERLKSDDPSSAGVYLHVNSNSVWAAIGGERDTSGLGPINQKNYWENETANPRLKLELNRVYTARYSVKVVKDRVKIVVTLEGKQIIEWTGPVSALNNKPQGTVPLVLSTLGHCAFHSYVLKLNTGKAVFFKS